VVLLDVGASPDASSNLLVRHAALGARYATALLGLAAPRIGLLSIGAEPGKGDRVRRAAGEALLAGQPGYIGTVEGHDVPLGGRADVVVTDGFTGNVLLKGIEGAFALAGGVAAESAALRAAVLLGVPGTVVVCHGAATGADLASGLALAARLHRNRVAVGHTDPAPAGTMGNPGPERSGLGKSGPAGPARPANLPRGSTATEQAALSWRNR